MNELTKFLVEGILNETTEKVVALFGGGFKPPTKGHLDVVNQGIKQNPEISEVKILVGGGERNGFTQDQAVKIWNLYNDVGFIDKPATIIPVSSPFTYYKNYLKDNPDDKVYVFIGSRPDDEKDQMDIKQRSEFVKKYSDNVIPVEVATTGGVSGTLARKLFKTDIDGFRNMFPENLLDEDFQKILNILNNKSTDNTQKSTPKSTEPLTPLNEDPKKGTGKKPKGSGRRLYTDEDPKDTVGIKFSTRQDIVDTLNKKSFKAKSHARQSQIINLIHQRVRAALGRTKDPAKKKKLRSGFEYIKKRKEASKAKTQRLKKLKEGDTYEKMAAKGKKAGSLKQGTVRKRLKIPKGKKIPLSLINKEISRMKKMDKDDKKKGVQLGDKNQKYYKALQLAKTLKTTTNLNEVLNPSTFDYKPIMASLTKSMEDDGLKLQPYPTVRFIHDEEANADDFFGRTAYYNPNNKEIVLYTLGRHPKDIMRSYAHELIHVHQDNEDRLHDVQTDDVNADEHLEQLEREAYETGNIMFRSWTNKITKDKDNISEGKKKGYKHKFGFNDKLGKDPFGLNMFARELALGLEEQEEKIDEPNIYLDMDGVVANFDKRFEDLSGMLPQAYVDKHGKNAFWDLIDEKHKVSFWRGIEVMPGANELVSFVSQYPYQMLTAPSVKKQSVIGKGLWVKDKVGTLYPSKPKVFYRKAKEKHMVKPELTKNDILVDDRPDTIARWDGAGGTAILFQSAGQVINDLKKLGL